MIAPVLLSASEPDPRRKPEYWDSRKLLNVREAVRAFCGHALAHFPVVFGGHPAITPLVKNVAARITMDVQAHDGAERKPQILLYQSGVFAIRDRSDDTIITDPHGKDEEGGPVVPRETGMRNESLLRMRYEMIAKPTSTKMPPSLAQDSGHWLLRNHGSTFGADREARLGTREFSAAVFIGGMEGVVREFRIFRTFHPNTPAFPIASTGSACAELLDQIADNLAGDVLTDLSKQTAYSLLMQKILPVHPDPAKPRWRAGQPPSFGIADHIDPGPLNRSLPIRRVPG
jgi:hypothetical protein